ncbi:MAG: hydantoinase B/oxoprolinase family protein [Stellaceae bacterium]
MSAVKPAAMRMWMTYPMTIVDTVFKALSPALPEDVMAGHHADLIVGRVNGRRLKDNSFYIYLGGLIGGGWGAKHDSDGMNATIAMNDGDTHNGPSEQVEAKYPLLVERYALRPDSGGAGKYRGGLGTEQVVQARNDIRFNAQIDRVKCRPWGLFGGLPAAGNGVAVYRFGADEYNFPSGKAFNQVLHSGDAYILRSGGGGGFGSPLDRDLDALEHDVHQGYVSRIAAERDYGAVFVSDTIVLDRTATTRRRVEMRARGLPLPEPDEPSAADGHHDHHRHDQEPSAHENLTEEERLVVALSARCCS